MTLENTFTKNSESGSELGQFIPIHYHYQMLLDQDRINGFAKAIESSVTSGSKVLDLGGGSGILSFYASKKAQKVWCVEKNPELANAAQKFLRDNKAENVEVIIDDAFFYLPPEPVDFVICEMLHSAMLREKQTVVLAEFQKNYLEKFGKLPNFIPATTMLAVQPVNQSFSFNGYVAPIPLFFPAGLENTSTIELSDPYIYSSFHYDKPLPQHFVCSREFTASKDGEINALRFITKNILSYLIEEEKSIDWYNLYLIMPLSKSVSVKTGQKVKISFSYPSGGRIECLGSSISVTASDAVAI